MITNISFVYEYDLRQSEGFTDEGFNPDFSFGDASLTMVAPHELISTLEDCGLTDKYPELVEDLKTVAEWGKLIAFDG
jgi:hypothetical protein